MGTSDVTRLLQQVRQGEASYDDLLETVYVELKQMAQAKVSRERDLITMGVTGLVHEAWLRLGGNELPNFENRQHFFAAAAEAMRRILIERARAVNRQKRGAGATRITLQDDHGAEQTADQVDLLALDQALDDLETCDREMAQVVKLRYFCGLTVVETADVLQVSTRTVDRSWMAARAWMKVRLA